MQHWAWLTRAGIIAAVLSPLVSHAGIPTECDLYTYRAVITRVIDGDTVVADIDLGFNTWRKDERLRLYGINAPEPRSATRKAGLAATQALRDALEGKQVVICTIKDCADSFGRYLARIFVVEGEPVSINAAMILAGHAVPDLPKYGCRGDAPVGGGDDTTGR